MAERGIIEQSSASYRKGVILGLTMAEIILLMTFLILLALASLLLEKERDHQKTRAKLVETKKLIADIAPDGNPLDFKELVRKHENILKRLNISENSLREKTIELAKANDDLVQTAWMRDLNEKLNTEDKDEFAALVKEVKELNDKQKSGKAEKSLPQLKLDNKRLSENNKLLQRRVSKLGGSGDPLQCWYNSETLKSEYIFDVAIRDKSFLIRDNALPHRAAEQAELPIKMIEFNKPLSPKKFMSQTRSLLQWSIEHECRFTVQAYDQVQGSKSVYKARLKQLEGRFYKLNRPGGKF